MSIRNTPHPDSPGAPAEVVEELSPIDAALEATDEAIAASDDESEADGPLPLSLGEQGVDHSEVGEPKREVPRAPESTTALSLRDPLQAYMREVGRHALLTPEEEKSLTQEYERTGDVEIARRLVTANLRLVIKLAYEYRRAFRNMMDLIQEGNIGLMQAVSRYDPYRGVKLSSYSAWWIRAYMLRFILNNSRLVKLGTTQAQRKLFFNLNKQKAQLTAMGIDPTPEVIAERLGVKPKEVVEMDLRLASAEASLDAPLGDSEGRQVARVELLASADDATDEIVARQQFDALINKHLAVFRGTLKDKDLKIFDERMTAHDPLTLQQLGNQFGVSRERVRQLEARLRKQLGAYLSAELGDAVAMHR
jgi:RNA polymerase sigma-32 factor